MPKSTFFMLLAGVILAAGLTVAVAFGLGGQPASPVAMLVPLGAVLALLLWRRS